MLLDHLHATAGGVSNDVAQTFDQVMFTRQSPDHNGYYEWHIRMCVCTYGCSEEVGHDVIVLIIIPNIPNTHADIYSLIAIM